MDKISVDKLIKVIGVIVFCLFLVGAAVDTHESIPDNAIVWGDDTHKKYYGEHTWKEIQTGINQEDNLLDKWEGEYLKKNIRKMTLKEAKSLGYEADIRSVTSGDFTGETYSLTYAFLQRIGVTPKKSRWNSDGTWNY